MMQPATGWICPRCDKVHSPSVLSCDCAAPKGEHAKEPGEYRPQQASPMPPYWYQPLFYGVPSVTAPPYRLEEITV